MQGIRESAGWGPASWWPRAISSSSRTQTDPHPSQGTGGAASLSVGGCQTEKGIVEWVTREPLLSTECRAIPRFHRRLQFAPEPPAERRATGATRGFDTSELVTGRGGTYNRRRWRHAPKN